MRRTQIIVTTGDSVLCAKMKNITFLPSDLSVSFYKQIVYQVCISDLRVRLALALSSGRTISDSSVAVPLPVKEGQRGYPPQRFVWTTEGIKLRKALAEIIVSKKKKNGIGSSHPPTPL